MPPATGCPDTEPELLPLSPIQLVLPLGELVEVKTALYCVAVLLPTFTKVVCWLVARLGERGFRPGVVTRGYGGSTRDVRGVEASDDPRVVGDEPVLLAQRTGVPVAVGRNRPAAA